MVQSCALDAGIKNARGDILVTLDGDGQNDPAAIPALLENSIKVMMRFVAGGQNAWTLLENGLLPKEPGFCERFWLTTGFMTLAVH